MGIQVDRSETEVKMGGSSFFPPDGTNRYELTGVYDYFGQQGEYGVNIKFEAAYCEEPDLRVWCIFKITKLVNGQHVPNEPGLLKLIQFMAMSGIEDKIFMDKPELKAKVMQDGPDGGWDATLLSGVKNGVVEENCKMHELISMYGPGSNIMLTTKVVDDKKNLKDDGTPWQRCNVVKMAACGSGGTNTTSTSAAAASTGSNLSVEDELL